MYYNKTTHLLQPCLRFDTDKIYTAGIKIQKGVCLMNDYKEYPDNMNTAENTTETEAAKQTGTVILPPAGEQRAKPAASNGGTKAPFRVRTVAALCIACSLLGGLVSTGSYALYQHYNSDGGEPKQRRWIPPEAIRTPSTHRLLPREAIRAGTLQSMWKT